jgi:hypothetical protein
MVAPVRARPSIVVRSATFVRTSVSLRVDISRRHTAYRPRRNELRDLQIFSESSDLPGSQRRACAHKDVAI